VYTERAMLGSPVMECSLKLSEAVKRVTNAIAIFNYVSLTLAALVQLVDFFFLSNCV